MTEAIKEVSSLDALFNTSIDDLADLAAFETPPPGSYVLLVTMDAKEINGKAAVVADIEVVETVELTDKSGATVPVAPGTKFSTSFLIGNEFGLGNLKKFLAPFAAHFGTSNVGELVRDKIKNVQVASLVKNRKDKTDPDRVYGSLTNITIA